MTDDPKIMAREIFLAYAKLADRGKSAEPTIEMIRQGHFDDMPMFEIAALAIETERRRAAAAPANDDTVYHLATSYRAYDDANPDVGMGWPDSHFVRMACKNLGIEETAVNFKAITTRMARRR